MIVPIKEPRLALAELSRDALVQAASLLAEGFEPAEEAQRIRPATAVDLAIASILLRAGGDVALFASREQQGAAFGYANPERALADLRNEIPPHVPSRANGTFLGGPNGAFLTHAAGAGWAFRHRGEAAAAIAVFDRSLAESGEYHTGVNFAGVMRARTAFFSIESTHGETGHVGEAYGLAEATVVLRHPSELLSKLEGDIPCFVRLDISAFANESLQALAKAIAVAAPPPRAAALS